MRASGRCDTAVQSAHGIVWISRRARGNLGGAGEGARTSCGWRNASTMTFSTVWPTYRYGIRLLSWRVGSGPVELRAGIGPVRSSTAQRTEISSGGHPGLTWSCVLSHLTLSLIVLGYPDQAVTRIREALTRAQDLVHPYSLVYALVHALTIHQLRFDIQAVHEHAETTTVICEEQEFGLVGGGEVL